MTKRRQQDSFSRWFFRGFDAQVFSTREGLHNKFYTIRKICWVSSSLWPSSSSLSSLCLFHAIFICFLRFSSHSLVLFCFETLLPSFSFSSGFHSAPVQRLILFVCCFPFFSVSPIMMFPFCFLLLCVFVCFFASLTGWLFACSSLCPWMFVPEFCLNGYVLLASVHFRAWIDNRQLTSFCSLSFSSLR